MFAVIYFAWLLPADLKLTSASDSREALQSIIYFYSGLTLFAALLIWIKTLDDQISLWVDVGEPSDERIKKASRLADETVVVCFNSKSEVWWKQNQSKFSALPVTVLRFDWKSVAKLSALVQRTMDLTVTISENAIFLSGDGTDSELSIERLQ